jgi:hypothetical protein
MKMLEAEIIKRKMIEEHEERERIKTVRDYGLATNFNFFDVFDPNTNKRLKK